MEENGIGRKREAEEGLLRRALVAVLVTADDRRLQDLGAMDSELVFPSRRR